MHLSQERKEKKKGSSTGVKLFSKAILLYGPRLS